VEIPKREKRAMLLGVGLDNDDGHVRATRGEIFGVFGGSHDTHERMTEKCIKFSEKLKGRSKRLEDLHNDELLHLAAECKMDLLRPRRQED
jgi:hypothetical protein